MSLLRTSRLAAGLTKHAVFGLMARGLWSLGKAVAKHPFKVGLPLAGAVGGPIAAGMSASESMKGSKQDMSAEGFAQRMGYGG